MTSPTLSELEKIKHELVKLNKELHYKAFNLINSRTKIDVWDFNRVNNVLIYDPKEDDRIKLRKLLKQILDKYEYETRILSAKNVEEFRKIGDTRFFISFIDYSLSKANEIYEILGKLLSQHVVVLMYENYDEIKEIVDKYNCYYIKKPANFDEINSIVKYINDETIATVKRNHITGGNNG